MDAVELKSLDRKPQSIPFPSHRHAIPSGPWPWMDLESVEINLPQQIPLCEHEGCDICHRWLGYPQSHFPNWTPDQVARCKIASAIRDRRHSCKIYHVDVKDEQGSFTQCDRKGQLVTDDNQREFWRWLQISSRPSGLRARALFVDNLSGPVLQILGASYNIEPFFFSSSLNWIPARYQEDATPKQGDHITITLTFLRIMPTKANHSSNHTSCTSTMKGDIIQSEQLVHDDDELPNALRKQTMDTEVIDTQAPLSLSSDKYKKALFLDVLDIHMIRHLETSTIIFYHPGYEWCMTSASDLHSRFSLIGESVYWQDVFRRSKDPTFLLIAILWRAADAWDEALECLYSHICFLEGDVIHTNDIKTTRQLHNIRAHLLHYASLLRELRKTVQFILGTPNPAMDAFQDGQKEHDRKLLEKEGNNLLREIKRLEMLRQLQDVRLKNVMDLVFRHIHLQDSRRMQSMTEASARDNDTMKQITYVSMIFFPISFVAAIFGMNVHEITPHTHGSLPKYAAAVILLTAFTIWVFVAFQTKNYLREQDQNIWTRMFWPIMFAKEFFERRKRSVKDRHA